MLLINTNYQINIQINLSGKPIDFIKIQTYSFKPKYIADNLITNMKRQARVKKTQSPMKQEKSSKDLKAQKKGKVSNDSKQKNAKLSKDVKVSKDVKANKASKSPKVTKITKEVKVPKGRAKKIKPIMPLPSMPIAEQKKQIKKIQEKKHKIQEQKTTNLNKGYRTKSILDELLEYSCTLQQNKKYKIKMHSTYQIDEKHKLYSQIQTLFDLFIRKEKKKAEQVFVKTRYSFYPVFEFLLAGQNVGEHKCCICQFQFQQPKQINQLERLLLDVSDEDIISLKCSHLLHLQCLKMLIGQKQWFRCPVCSMIYGRMIGDQPPGTMSVSKNNFTHCQSYQDVGTIVIHYQMNSGNNGTISYPGTGRTAYLPDNLQGNQVLGLLQQAFNRKLIFTIGRSVTTGRDNQIVWNGIHHKTNVSGGSAYFGYPDPTYFDRVKQELAAKGVF